MGILVIWALGLLKLLTCCMHMVRSFQKLKINTILRSLLDWWNAQAITTFES